MLLSADSVWMCVIKDGFLYYQEVTLSMGCTRPGGGGGVVHLHGRRLVIS